MSVEEKIAQTLHPFVRPQQSEEEIREILGDLVPGGVFVMGGTADEIRRTTEFIQRLAGTPVVISSDLECGPGRMIRDATTFPFLMSLAAAGKKTLARTMGKSAAREGREVGIHWSFGPVVDINLCPINPITNTRSLGDDVDTIIELAAEFIAGMQENKMAACAKHFPGDGLDSRDQHICTSINPLEFDSWWDSFGRVYRTLINRGVRSIMIGHIALPACDPGKGISLADAPPATLSAKITTELLRQRLGFDGMIISDASVMGGVTTWGPREEIIPDMLQAGCDQILFCHYQSDFAILNNAVSSGKLSMARLDDAVRRVLLFKEQLGLFDDVFGEPVSDAERERNRQAGKELAESALTIATDRFDALPLYLQPGDKVLSFHVRTGDMQDVDLVDQRLQEAGFDITRMTEVESYRLAEGIDDYAAVLVHMVLPPGWNTNDIRPAGTYLRELIASVPFYDRRVVFISYGTPYLLHDLPRIPALINAYSYDLVTQQAVADLLLGKIKANGKSPVNLRLDKSWFSYFSPK